jgi:hypothetical protein
MSPLYGGKCLPCKAGHNWVEKGGKRFADKEIETKVWKWLRLQREDFSAACFDVPVKQWDKCINVGGGYVEK